MNFDEKSILSTMDPVLTILGFILIILISLYSAHRYRNTYDFKKSLKCALLLFVIVGVTLFFFKVPLFLIIGYGICTYIITAGISNYYFYH